MLLGVQENLDNDAYRADKERISVSELKVFADSPWKYKQQYLDGKKEKGNSAQGLGTLCHDLFLEPGKTKYSIYEIEKRFLTPTGQYGKAAEAEIARLEANARKMGLQPVEKNQFEKALRLTGKTSAMYRHVFGEQAFRAEVSFFTKEKKGRLDALLPNAIVDYKTTKVLPTNDEWQGQILQWKYHWQAAWYLDLVAEVTGEVLPKFYWLIQQTESPEEAIVYECDPSAIEIGRYEYRQAYKTFQHYKALNSYPVMLPQEPTCGLPGWYSNRFYNQTKTM